MYNIFTFLGAFVFMLPFLLILALAGTMWRAWWFYPAWEWFIVPLGVPAISFWHFTALVFLLTTLTQHVDIKKDDRKTEWAAFVVSFLWPIAAWGLLRWMR